VVVVDVLKNLSYRTPVRWLAKSLHLERILRKIYYRWTRPRDGIFRLRVGSISALYRVHTSGELREVDQRIQPRGEMGSLEYLTNMLRSGDTVYDVGAHIGLYTVPFAKRVGPQGRVIAFEPAETTHDHLLQNLRLNTLANVRAFAKALGEQNSHARLYHGEENTQQSLLPASNGQDLGHEMVEVVAGDLFVERERLPLPRLVKIDVEGYECAVLRGLSRTLSSPQCEIVCCEIHPQHLPPGVASHDAIDLLKAFGFTRIDIESHRGTFHAIGCKGTPS